MDVDDGIDLAKFIFKAIPYGMYGLLLISAFAGWWGIFTWVAGSMVVGAVIASVVASFEKEFSRVPLIGGYAGFVGLVLHVIFRLQVWFG